MGKITVETCEIEGLKIITPTVFGDERGYFMETYNYNDYKVAGIDMEFVHGMLFVRLEGVLSKRTSKELNEVLDRMIHVHGVRYFVINLEDLSFLDEEGVSVIMSHYHDIVLHDGRLIVCGDRSHLNQKVADELDQALPDVERSSDELSAFRLMHI